MSKEEPYFFYKIMLTEGQHADLMAVIASYRISTTNEKEIKLIEKLALAIILAQKEERE